MYADFDYYSNTFCDVPAPIAEDERDMYLEKASAFLRSLFLNGEPTEPSDQRIKSACCGVAPCFYAYDKREGISSETNDGYSISFADGGGFERAEKKALAIARYYLAGTGLLYRGAVR